jgi:hypothetical protein
MHMNDKNRMQTQRQREVAVVYQSSETSEGADLARRAAHEVARLWDALLSWPLEIFAACEARSVRSYLSEVTGLSPAHVSKRGLAITNPKRLDRVVEHVQHYVRQTLQAKGYSQSEIEQLVETFPRTPLAGLVHRFGQALPVPLTLAMELGARIDGLAVAAIQAAESDALDVYRALLLRWLDDELLCPRDAALDAEILDLQRVVTSANDWSGLLGPTDSIVQYAMLATLSAVDVEWGAYFFRTLTLTPTPTPTFHWLFPRFHSDFDLQNSKSLKRNIVARPVERALELLWIIAKRGTSERLVWPDALPGPSRLAQDIADEHIGDGNIRKWSCGAMPISLDQMVELWASLTLNLSNRGCIDVPIPWMAVALWMDRSLVRRRSKSSKPGTVIALPEPSYKAIWVAQRRRWKEQLPEPGDRPWPEWLLAQSAWPDWLRPSQSSGRLSSPRDCQ